MVGKKSWVFLMGIAVTAACLLLPVTGAAAQGVPGDPLQAGGSPAILPPDRGDVEGARLALTRDSPGEWLFPSRAYGPFVLSYPQPLSTDTTRLPVSLHDGQRHVTAGLARTVQIGTSEGVYSVDLHNEAFTTVGYHHYQSNPPAFAGQLARRAVCFPTPAAGPDAIRAFRDHHQQFHSTTERFIYAACHVPSTYARYKTGPSSAAKGSKDVFGPGTSSTPRPRDYRRWARDYADVFGSELVWEVWNEPDSPQFYRGSPHDLADLTEVALEVFGSDNVVLPGFTAASVLRPDAVSGWVRNGKRQTRARFMRVYYQVLLQRLGVTRFQELTPNFHGYGNGATPAEAARERRVGLQRFAAFLKSFPISPRFIDSEWNLRASDSAINAELTAFADSAAAASEWTLSAADASCVSAQRTDAYMWTDRHSAIGFESTQLQLNPDTPHLADALSSLSRGIVVACAP